jgi:hypothetical protein
VTVSSQNSDQSNWQQVNQLMTDFKADKNKRVIRDEAGTNVVILDKNGLRTTAPGGGIDVITADDADVTFDSARNVFKITDIAEQEVFAAANTTATYTIPHGKAYVPIVMAYVRTGGSYDPLPTSFSIVRDDPNQMVLMGAWVEVYSDETNIYINIFNALASRVPVGTGFYEVKYYLLQESAGE